MLVIHEIFGLTDWAKNLADELAAAGYIAIAPDLLSAPGKDTQSYPDQDAAIKAVSALQDAQIFADLDAAADYAPKLPACNGRSDGHRFLLGWRKVVRLCESQSDI